MRKIIISVIVLIFFFLFPKNVSAQIVFQDQFTSNADKWISSGVSGWTLKDGEYGILVEEGVSNSVPINSLWNNSWNNYIYEVRLRGVQGVDKNIVFRYTDDENFYEIHHSSDNRIYLERARSEQLGGGYHIASIYYPLENGQIYNFKFEIIFNHFIVYINNQKIFDDYDSVDPILSGKIGLRVGTGAVAPSEVWYDNVIVTLLQVNVTPLVVVVPGLGASWNTEAVLSCDPDYEGGEWVLNPLFEGTYMPLINTFNAASIETRVFNYDWRKDVRDSSDSLKNLLSSLHFIDKDVSIVGYSLGGLVSRAYLEKPNVGSNVKKVLTVGSPHQGASGTYATWEGGETKMDSFQLNMAVNILKMHCGILRGKNNRGVVQTVIPSIRNILPTYSFLRDWKTGASLTLSSNNINDWLISSFTPPLGISFGTLSGTGVNTLKFIDVKPRTKNDEKIGDWEDGVPIGKGEMADGDGMVLTESSQLVLTGVENLYLNQTHGGLISSSQGIDKIIEFLGLPATTSNIASDEIKSALMIIGYPASFSITDRSGRLLISNDGLIAIPNPNVNNFKLSLVPNSDQTLFIVGQFLENGRVLWKEYDLKGKEDKHGTISFDPDFPFEDPLLID
ncbi:MAG: hypothetical protein V1858_01095 [Candidatus Gottesmanbacteria bacterium]